MGMGVSEDGAATPRIMFSYVFKSMLSIARFHPLFGGC
jgi:hypothetical protein